MKLDHVFVQMNSVLLALTCLKKTIHILPPRGGNSKHRSPTDRTSSIPEIIYVHDTGGLGETAVVNFNAGQEVESMWGTSGPRCFDLEDFFGTFGSGMFSDLVCFRLAD